MKIDSQASSAVVVLFWLNCEEKRRGLILSDDVIVRLSEKEVVPGATQRSRAQRERKVRTTTRIRPADGRFIWCSTIRRVKPSRVAAMRLRSVASAF
jgi:hypothetical protein